MELGLEGQAVPGCFSSPNVILALALAQALALRRSPYTASPTLALTSVCLVREAGEVRWL